MPTRKPTATPPKIDEAWLRKLRPRDELIARYALRGLMRRSLGATADKAFSDRIEQLRVGLDLDEDGFASVLHEARLLQGRMVGQLPGEGEKPKPRAKPVRKRR